MSKQLQVLQKIKCFFRIRPLYPCLISLFKVTEFLIFLSQSHPQVEVTLAQPLITIYLDNKLVFLSAMATFTINLM